MTAEPVPLLEPASRAELRAWLAENHTTSTGVDLAIGKKNSPVTALTYDDAVEEALAFGWIDSVTHRLDEHRYTIRLTPRKRGSIWAKSNKERVARLTEAGLMAPAGLAAVESAQTDGSWELLDAINDLVVPDDLAAALCSAHVTRQFAALTASQCRMTLYWIASAKRPETRAKRIAETVHALSDGRNPV